MGRGKIAVRDVASPAVQVGQQIGGCGVSLANLHAWAGSREAGTAASTQLRRRETVSLF